MQVLGVIPARYASTRFPGKPLADIGGKTLVQRVWERAARCKSLARVVVATEDERIAIHVRGFGGTAVMTRNDHVSGTDRLGEVAEAMRFDYYVNMQGDEPLLSPGSVDDLVQATLARQAPMGTLVAPLTGDPADPNVCKVVVDAEGRALYFSRSVIPHARSEGAAYLRHIGIYIYSRETLLKLCSLPPAMLERAESLEQLRALYHGIPILTVDSGYESVEVNAPEDVAKVLARLAEQQ